MKFFISSTYEDLKEIRKVAIKMFELLTHNLSGSTTAMEYFEASTASSLDVCMNKIEQADIIIGIYGKRFGFKNLDGRSMTEMEFDKASSLGKPILSFVAVGAEHDAEADQKRFINEKVFRSGGLCARFEITDLLGFANVLNGTLKQYFCGLEGYSYTSIWDDINKLKQTIEQEDYPRLIPYGENEEDNALNAITESVFHLSNMVEDLQAENSVVYDMAYYYDLEENEKGELSPDVKEEFEREKTELLGNIKKQKDKIKSSYDWVTLGIPNHCTRISLATNYLKLCRIQKKLLTEIWSEDLRQEILRIKALYIDTVVNQSGLVD